MLRLFLTICCSVFICVANAENTVQKLYKSVNSGVVELHVKALAEPQPGQVRYRETTAGSLGSGALINEKGRILTAAHVVERATEIEVIFHNGHKTSGHVVWIEPLLDLAMIQAVKVPQEATVLPLADSGKYHIGDQVVVIGAPYGVSHSLSVGYLSGIRDKEALPGTEFKPRLIQTDAAINVGNSGGPLFNLKGEIIGIVSHILSQTGGSNGLGFAVSVDTVHDVINSDPGTFSGFIPFLLTKKLSLAINNPYEYGLLLQQVIPGTLAHKLGFKGGHLNIVIGKTPLLLGGDILLEISGRPLRNIEEVLKVKRHLATYEKGDKITFKFLRNGKVEQTFWIVD